MNNSTVGLTNGQIANGTPAQKKFILKSFFKGDKCRIAPAKDGNGRYKGIRENISDIEKQKMGYVPGIESSIKIYDGVEIDLNDDQWKKDWEWMKYCREISDNFAEGQETPGAYFYIYRPGMESERRVNVERREHKIKGYIFGDTSENLYNRAKVLGNDMSASTLSDVEEFLLGIAKINPEQIINMYEGDTYSLELLYLHAMEVGAIKKRGGSFVFGDIFLGVDKKGVISYLGNSRNSVTVTTIEAVTYGRNVVPSLDGELVADDGGDDAADLREIENSPKVVTAAAKAKAARASKK